jgi:hypothetical protein
MAMTGMTTEIVAETATGKGARMMAPIRAAATAAAVVVASGTTMIRGTMGTMAGAEIPRARARMKKAD